MKFATKNQLKKLTMFDKRQAQPNSHTPFFHLLYMASTRTAASDEILVVFVRHASSRPQTAATVSHANSHQHGPGIDLFLHPSCVLSVPGAVQPLYI